MDAKVFLKQVKRLDIQIMNKLGERQRMRDLALRITASMDKGRLHTSGPHDKIESAVIKLVNAEAEVDALVDELVAAKKEVVQTIEQLDSALEYNVLHMIYIQDKLLLEVADHYGKSYGWATTVHGRALKSVQKLLDGE